MNAIDLLKEDHSRVDRLFKKVKDTPKGEHPALFEQIKAELDVHTQIEESVFYPALEKKGNKELKDITLEGIEEHRQAKMFLTELAALPNASKRFEAKLKVLMEDIEHHVKEEEDTMFPLVNDQFTEAALDKLGRQMERSKSRIVKTMTPGEVAALKRSLATPDPKGTLATIVDKAKKVVNGLMSSDAPRSTRARKSSTSNGRQSPAKPRSAKSAKTIAAKRVPASAKKGATAKLRLVAKKNGGATKKTSSAKVGIRTTGVSKATRSARGTAGGGK